MISKKEVEHIANLAKLELGKKEVEKMQGEMNQILEYVEMLNQVDASKIAPTSHSVPLENVYREDNPEKDKSEMLNQAPETEKDFIKVKGVL